MYPQTCSTNRFNARPAGLLPTQKPFFRLGIPYDADMSVYNDLLAVSITPLIGAVCIGFLLTTVLHEFLHAFVAYLGGDRSELNRKQLADPRSYIHPVYSLLLPGLFVLLGGLPLVGGAVYINRDSLRSKWWALAVDLAGVAGNFVVFLVLGYILRFVPFNLSSELGRNLYGFVAALCYLEIFTVLLNLMPIPPLDGFHALSNFMKEEQRQAMLRLGGGWTGLLILYFLLSYAGLGKYYNQIIMRLCDRLGIPFEELAGGMVFVFGGS
jgi:Zn-dependent protease